MPDYCMENSVWCMLNELPYASKIIFWTMLVQLKDLPPELQLLKRLKINEFCKKIMIAVIL